MERPFRRRVFYIPGYDPFPPRRYRELYRKEGAAQAAVSGYDLTLKPDRKGWRVEAFIGGPADARAEVLVWTDIVRSSMGTGIAGTYLQLVQTAWIYLTTGALFRLMRLRKGPVVAALFPVGVLLLQLLAAVALAYLIGRGANLLVPATDPWLGWLLAGIVLVLVLRWFKRKDGRILAYYLMHDYAFSARWRGANPPALEARMAVFRQTIAEALHDDVDEVLVVGHSSGAHIGISVLADVIREGLPTNRPALGFLSLGQVVPMVSFLPDATRLRADLHMLSASDALTWVDVTAPGDGCAFALCDPVSVTGVAPADKRWPLVISAAFTQTLSPERWKELRWQFFRLHFQYMCAFDRPRDYDYFAITAGPITLAERFAGRAPSASRIETPLSGHVDRAA